MSSSLRLWSSLLLRLSGFFAGAIHLYGVIFFWGGLEVIFTYEVIPIFGIIFLFDEVFILLFINIISFLWLIFNLICHQKHFNLTILSISGNQLNQIYFVFVDPDENVTVESLIKYNFDFKFCCSSLLSFPLHLGRSTCHQTQ